MMRRLGLAGTLLALLGLFGFITAQAASAAPQTLVIQVNVTMPGTGYVVLGTLTAQGDDVTGRGTWSFQGTINSQLAIASGTGTLSNTASGAVLTITGVTSWQMPYAAQPAPESQISVGPGPGSTVLLSYGPLQNVPVAMNPPASFPLPPGTYTASAPGTGAQPLPTLPNTGAAPQPIAVPSLRFDRIAPLFGFVALLLVGSALAAHSARRTRHANPIG